MAQSGHRSNGPINLAHEPPFRLGEIEIHPATRQIVRGDRRETLQPRIMQVLVALAQADGAILTRDELIERCWGGTIVGENAIQRAISRIRDLAEEFGPDAFDVETITKVGYRMLFDGSASASAPAAMLSAPAPPRTTAIDRRLLIGVAAATLGLGAAGAWWWSRHPEGYVPSPAALALYRKGLEAQGQNNPERSMQAVAFFQEAVRTDPAYADAWGALALGYRALLEYGPRTDMVGLATLSRSAAARALELDPDNADAEVALLLVRPMYRNWASFEAGCRRLLRRHPEHSILRFNLGWMLGEVGRWRAAVPELEEVNAREPFWPVGRRQLILSLWSAGRLEEADNALDHAITRWPLDPGFWSIRYRLLLHAGRPAAALAFANDASARPPSYPPVWLERLLATAQALESGAVADIDAAVALALRTVERAPMEALYAAEHCALLGRNDEAFDLFNGYYHAKGRWAASAPQPDTPYTRRHTGMLFHPLLPSLRGDPRFAALTESIGLEDYWRKAGTDPDYRR
jgi:DNA-binding winged helix-turn-helix (wHTH) protein/tetratricopeptide (TPR) repeat protein